jgi:hypothetical protein
MAKRNLQVGSPPCLDSQSKSTSPDPNDKLIIPETNSKVETRESTPRQLNTVILNHWYRYGFEPDAKVENQWDLKG